MFLQRRHTDVYKAHEKVLSIIIIREKQIKATMRYVVLTPVRMAIIKESTWEFPSSLLIRISDSQLWLGFDPWLEN